MRPLPRGRRARAVYFSWEPRSLRSFDRDDGDVTAEEQLAPFLEHAVALDRELVATTRKTNARGQRLERAAVDADLRGLRIGRRGLEGEVAHRDEVLRAIDLRLRFRSGGA